MTSLSLPKHNVALKALTSVALRAISGLSSQIFGVGATKDVLLPIRGQNQPRQTKEEDAQSHDRGPR